MVHNTLSSQDASSQPNLRFLDQILLEICSGHDYSNNKVRVQGQGHSDPKMVCDTPPYHDAFTHQIWNSYLIEYRRYAPDSMQFLETRSEVKFKVTVTQLLYATLRHPKTHPHTKFEIPISNNIRDMLRTRLFKKLGQRSRSL